MMEFLEEIEREDKSIDFVGTSMQGTIDPGGESEEKRRVYDLLLKKKANGARLRALLMHPAYGEFRERVENREAGAVARDIQGTLKFLVSRTGSEVLGVAKDARSTTTIEEHLLSLDSVRLYPGVVTAYAIITTRSMLINISTLHGPVYDNFALIVRDTGDPNSLFKRFKQHHFEVPWGSEKTVRLSDDDGRTINDLLETDYSKEDSRVHARGWPPRRTDSPSTKVA